MFGIGTWELVVILALALIILGPAKLPQVAKTIGKGLASLRESVDEVKKEIDLGGLSAEITDKEIPREIHVESHRSEESSRPERLTTGKSSSTGKELDHIHNSTNRRGRR